MELQGLPSPMFNVSGLTDTQKLDAGLMYVPEVDMPTVDVGNSALNTGFEFLGDNLSSIGTFASVIGGIMANRSDAKYRDKIYKEEKRRVAREEKRQDDFDAAMDKAYA